MLDATTPGNTKVLVQQFPDGGSETTYFSGSTILGYSFYRSFDDGSSELSFMDKDHVSIGSKFIDSEGNISSISTTFNVDGSSVETGLESIPFREWTYNFGTDGVLVSGTEATNYDTVVLGADFAVQSSTPTIALLYDETTGIKITLTGALSSKAAADITIKTMVNGTSQDIPITFTADGSTAGVFTASESVSTFTADDIPRTGGTISNFSGSGTSYTAQLNTESNGVVTIDISPNLFTNALGTPNMASTQYLLNFDNLAPVITIPDLLTPGTSDKICRKPINTADFRLKFLSILLLMLVLSLK